jgi:uncharacterized protein
VDFFQMIAQNLLSAPILFFFLGLLGGFLKSDLEIPPGLSKTLSIYLMVAIGFKGGSVISETSLWDPTFLAVVFFGLFCGFCQPILGYFLLRRTTPLSVETSAAVAAHYGSVSVLTFATALSFLKGQGVHYAGYMVAILALMEAPAIISGLWLAQSKKDYSKNTGNFLFKILTHGVVLLLLGSFVIGWITGLDGMMTLASFFKSPFQGILCLFLLDMGLLVSRNMASIKSFKLSIAFFGLYMPLVGALIALLFSYCINLSVGNGALLAILLASASYIAVPAAMRLALPEADAGIYVPLSLAITFPFNVTFGIPLYYTISQMILR